MMFVIGLFNESSLLSRHVLNNFFGNGSRMQDLFGDVVHDVVLDSWMWLCRQRIEQKKSFTRNGETMVT